MLKIPKPTLDDSEAEKRLEKIEKAFSPKRIERATRTAENKAARFGRNELRKEVRSIIALKGKPLNSGVTVRTGKGTTPAAVRFSGELTDLKDFRSPKQKAEGVAVTIKPGKRVLLRSTFIVDKLGKNIFKRKTAARLPIRKLTGPSLAKVAPEAIRDSDETIRIKLGDEVELQIDKLWEKATK